MTKTFRPKQFNTNPNQAAQAADFVGDPPKNNNQPSKGPFLKVISLGGVGDVTKNMYVYEYGDDILVIDCGVGFPDEGMLGVDLVIPDITYLRGKIDKIRGIVISHGHDDHIGGLPYLWPELKAPIYTQKLTAGLIRAKFTEHKLSKDKINTVNVNDTLKLGVFEVSFYYVSHSIPDATGIVIKTPVGTVIHQADFKLDWTPVNGQQPDLAKLAKSASNGVVFMTIDSLGSTKPGYTKSEQTIQPVFESIEQQVKGKLLVTLTSSNISRIQQAVNVAVKAGRKVAFSGRSMESNFQVARDLGYLDVPPGVVVPQEELKRYPDEKLMIVIAGSQGQPDSALARAAHGDHKYVRINKEDGVIFSSDPIPGMEAGQGALIDVLTKLGCSVYYSALTPGVHVSGHASSEELKQIVGIAKPKYILPIGGAYSHMKAFQMLVAPMGYKENQVLQPRDGQIVTISASQARIDGEVEMSNVYVDGLGVGDVGSIILRDRQVMSEEGIVVVIVPISHHSGQLAGEPDVISRGFVYGKESEDLMEAAKEIVKSVLRDSEKEPIDWRYTRHQIEEHLDKFFFGEIKRQPLVLPVITEV